MNSDVGFTAPLSSAAAAVTTLNVEPGGYSPWVARLSSGAEYEQAAVRIRVIAEKFSSTTFGLKVGLEAIARIRPVFGSIATAAPHFPDSARTATCCARESSVR